MKNFFSKLWVKITAISLAVILYLFSLLLLINSFAPYNPKCYHLFGYSGIFGSINRIGSPATYYQSEKTSNVIEFIDLRPDNSELGYVFINVSDMQEDADIYLYNGIDTTEKTSMTLLSQTSLTGKDLQNDKDGWICIYENNKNTNLNLRFYIGSTTKMRIREVVFVHKTGGIIKYKVKGIVRRGNDSIIDEEGNAKTYVSKEDSLYQIFDYETLSTSTNYTTTFTPEMQERVKSLANLKDEEKTFNKEIVEQN